MTAPVVIANPCTDYDITLLIDIGYFLPEVGFGTPFYAEVFHAFVEVTYTEWSEETNPLNSRFIKWRGDRFTRFPWLIAGNQ